MSNTRYTAVEGDEGADIAVTAVAVETIPEAQGLTWEDTFFNSSSGVIAVFDVDYDKLERNVRRAKYIMIVVLIVYGLFMVVIPSLAEFLDDSSDMDAGFLLYMFFLYGFLVTLYVKIIRMLGNSIKHIASTHVAVTTEGIRKETNNFPMGAIFRTSMLVREFVIILRRSWFIIQLKCVRLLLFPI